MVQNIRTLLIHAGEKKIIFDKPFALHRIFFSIVVMTSPTEWFETQISFDDPHFLSHYMINGPKKYFESKGGGIFQGNIWAYNVSDHDLIYALSEILI